MKRMLKGGFVPPQDSSSSVAPHSPLGEDLTDSQAVSFDGERSVVSVESSHHEQDEAPDTLQLGTNMESNENESGDV